MLVILNKKSETDKETRFVLWAGIYGTFSQPTYFNFYGDLDDAMNAMVDWLAENKPGLLCDDEVRKAYEEYIDEHKAEYEDEDELRDKATEYAETDVTRSESSYISSQNWGIALENPTRSQMIELLQLIEKANYSGGPTVEYKS